MSEEIEVELDSDGEISAAGDRRLFIKGGISEDMVPMVIGEIFELEEENPKAPICVWILSEGGDLEAGFAIYDVLRACSAPIITIGTGRVYSAATIIMQAGDIRVATRHCCFMHHTPISTGQAMTHEQAKAFTSEYGKWLDFIKRIMLDNSKLTPRTWNKLFHTSSGLYFETKDAIESYGLIDYEYQGEDHLKTLIEYNEE